MTDNRADYIRNNREEIMTCLSMIPDISLSGLAFEYGGLFGLGKISKVTGYDFSFCIQYSLFSILIGFDGYALLHREKYAVDRNFWGNITNVRVTYSNKVDV